MTGVWIALGALALLWVLARRRLYELWDEVQAARRQVDLQRLRKAELAPRLGEALGDRLSPEHSAALRGDDQEARDRVLQSLPPPISDEPPTLASMRTDLGDIELRLAARLRVLAAENARYRWLAPAWIGRIVGAPLPSALPPAPEITPALPPTEITPAPPRDESP